MYKVTVTMNSGLVEDLVPMFETKLEALEHAVGFVNRASGVLKSINVQKMTSQEAHHKEISWQVM